MRIELLRDGYMEHVKDLLLSQTAYFGVPIEQFPFDIASNRAMTVFLNRYLRSPNDYSRCYGAIDDGESLLGIICVDFMQDEPTWLLRRICVDQNIKGAGEEIIQELMTAALDHAEEHGYFQHMYLIPQKYQRAHAKIWGGNPRRENRYVAFELERVEANATPKFRMHWEALYGQVTYPVATVVRTSLLLDEFRR